MGQKTPYFGIIDDIWELDYGMGIQMAMFKCRWVKQHQVNDIGLTVVDLENIGYADDPWVLASCVWQNLLNNMAHKYLLSS
jgi:hypothetical protein